MRKRMTYRRFNMGDRGRVALPGKIAGSDFLEIQVEGGVRYTVWPSEVDGALMIQAEDGNMTIRPHSRVVAVKGFSEL